MLTKKLTKKQIAQKKADERNGLNRDKNRDWDDKPKVLQQSREQILQN